MSEFIRTITSDDPTVRNRSLDAGCAPAIDALLAECAALDRSAARATTSTSGCGRSSFSTPSIAFTCRPAEAMPSRGLIPYDGYATCCSGALRRRSTSFWPRPLLRRHSSALATAYHQLAFPDAGRPGAAQRALGARQPVDVPAGPSRRPAAARAARALRRRPKRTRSHALFPILRETTPVRMDLTHSGWSDIFFLGMDFPEGARVLNISIDLAVRGQLTTRRPRPSRPSRPTSA